MEMMRGAAEQGGHEEIMRIATRPRFDVGLRVGRLFGSFATQANPLQPPEEEH